MTFPELVLAIMMLTAFTSITVMVTEFTSRFYQPLNEGAKEEYISSNRELNDKLNKQAEIFSKGPINAYKSVKKLLNESFHNTLEAQMEMESVHISNNAETKDGIEGLTAFSEKRKPKFID